MSRIIAMKITCVSMQTIHSRSSKNGADGVNSFSYGADGAWGLFSVFISIS